MKFISSGDFLDRLNQWFNGLIALPLLAGSFGYLEIFSGRLTGVYQFNSYASGLIIFVVVMAVAAISRSYKKQIKAISKEDGLHERLEVYFWESKAFYIKMFIISLITVVGLYITGSVVFAGLYAFQLFVLSVFKPTLLLVANKLGLKGEVRTNFLRRNTFTLN